MWWWGATACLGRGPPPGAKKGEKMTRTREARIDRHGKGKKRRKRTEKWALPRKGQYIKKKKKETGRGPPPPAFLGPWVPYVQDEKARRGENKKPTQGKKKVRKYGVCGSLTRECAEGESERGRKKGDKKLSASPPNQYSRPTHTHVQGGVVMFAALLRSSSSSCHRPRKWR